VNRQEAQLPSEVITSAWSTQNEARGRQAIQCEGQAMNERVELRTKRLLLRPYLFSDAEDLQHLAGEFDVARGTLCMPHPYEDGMAEDFITAQESAIAKGEVINLGIFLQESEELIGGIGLEIKKEHNTGELGYWIGKPHWGNGYCTEAAAAVVEFGFSTLGLRKLFAEHFADNPASGRVLEKLGFRNEGCRRKHLQRFGKVQDIELFGLLREEHKNP
jgi:ribosomal-protein-alanine N-acetyltransferase